MNPTTDRILKEKLIAVLRLSDTSRIAEYAERIVSGGITILEVTLNSQNALECIELLNKKFPDCLIGAGTAKTPRHPKGTIGTAEGAEAVCHAWLTVPP